jgi:polysaccharide biosynthesis protein PelE
MQETAENAGETRSWVSGLGLLLALSAECGALLYAVQGEEALAIGLHALSSLLFGAWAADGKVMTRPGIFVAACVMVFTIPALGALGVAFLVVPAWRTQRPAEDDGVVEISLPHAAAASGEGNAAQEGAAAVRIAPAPIEVVLRSQGTAQKRVASVMALRRMDAQRAVPLLRVALGDKHEDVRLLAYAILERREKELRGRIEVLLGDLEALQGADAAAEDKQRALVLKSLAEQHWELVHGGFLSGDVEKQTLESAVRYGHESLLIAPDGSLSLLIARMQLKANKPNSALHYLRGASSLGVANSVLAPLYAEAAFLLRRFEAIGPLLAEAGNATFGRPKLDAVARFWTGREDQT